MIDLTLEEFQNDAEFCMAEFCKMFCFTLVTKNKQYQKTVTRCNQLQASKNALFKQTGSDQTSGGVALKLDIVELDAMKQGAKV